MAYKITNEMRRTCLALAVESADRESAQVIVGRALLFEQYLSGEVADRMVEVVPPVEAGAPGDGGVEGG